jgi:hypothetical protein
MGRDSGEKTAKQQERRNIVTHRSSTECQVPALHIRVGQLDIAGPPLAAVLRHPTINSLKPVNRAMPTSQYVPYLTDKKDTSTSLVCYALFFN